MLQILEAGHLKVAHILQLQISSKKKNYTFFR